MAVAPHAVCTLPPLAAVAHELRTPLGGILGCTELLAATSLDAEQRAHLDALREAALALAAFADDALELARLGDPAAHAAVRTAPCNVRATLAGVARTLAPSAARRRLTLDVEVAESVPAVVCVDPGALRRVLLNLGANALHATRRGGVEFMVTHEAAGTLVCAVRDTGVGMTKARQEQLFRAWATGDAPNEATTPPRAGLGLVLVAELVARMGGTLTVESAPGAGSTFTVCVPACADASTGGR